jgi:hypothetical protein
MPDYRAYIVGPDGHFVGYQPLTCVDDAEATETAKLLVDGRDVELWSGARLVIVLQYTSNEVRAFERQIDQSKRMSIEAADDATSARMDKLTSDLQKEKDEQQKRDEQT